MRHTTTEISWRPSYRIVASRFPPIDIFETLATPDDWDDLLEVEMLTNPRVREELGAIHLVRPEDRRTGPGWSPIMAAFCHGSRQGSRFTDGGFGAYYCADNEDTAIAETCYHTQRFLREASQPPTKVHKRVYLADLDAPLVDLRGEPPTSPYLDPDDYRVGQALGNQLWQQGHYGVVYPSVRAPGTLCAAVLRPPALSATRQGRHLEYEWDGERIRNVFAITLVSKR